MINQVELAKEKAIAAAKAHQKLDKELGEAAIAYNKLNQLAIQAKSRWSELCEKTNTARQDWYEAGEALKEAIVQSVKEK